MKLYNAEYIQQISFFDQNWLQISVLRLMSDITTHNLDYWCRLFKDKLVIIFIEWEVTVIFLRTEIISKLSSLHIGPSCLKPRKSLAVETLTFQTTLPFLLKIHETLLHLKNNSFFSAKYISTLDLFFTRRLNICLTDDFFG